MVKDAPFEIVYSRQTSDFQRGKAYSNPRFFTTPRRGVTKVYIIGYWPKIEAAYKAMGVPVEVIGEEANGGLAPLTPKPVTGLATGGGDLSANRFKPVEPAAPAPEPAEPVEIPENWRDLPWVGDNSLRVLAMKVSTAPVLNKGQAVAAIMAELARRGTQG